MVNSVSLSPYSFPEFSRKKVLFSLTAATIAYTLQAFDHQYLAAAVGLATIAALSTSTRKSPSFLPLVEPLPLLALAPTPKPVSSSPFRETILHPFTYPETTLKKILTVVGSFFLHLFTLGGIRYLLENRPIQTLPLTPNQSIRVYPGDLTSSEKANWKVAEAMTPRGKQLQFTLTSRPHIDFTIREQDLFQSGAQVLVNAANSHLGGGGGIDGAIHDKGGTDYAQAHKNLKKAYGGSDTADADYPLGHANLISSGDLQQLGIDSVVVVAGPQGSATAQKETELYSAYYNALVCAHQAGKKSIAFPAISTGIFGFPRDRAANISLKAVSDFLNAYPNTSLTTISIHSFRSKGDPKNGLDYYKDAFKSPPALKPMPTAPLQQEIAGVTQMAKTGVVAFYDGGVSGVLSNFYMHPLSVFGQVFQCGEGAFQWKKWHTIAQDLTNALTRQQRSALNQKISEFKIANGNQAFQLNRALGAQYPGIFPSGWIHGLRDKVMWEIVTHKKQQIKGLDTLLKATGSAYLLEHKQPTKGQDDYWSDGNGLPNGGCNVLGKMWMAQRQGHAQPSLRHALDKSTVLPQTQVANYHQLGIRYHIWP